MTDDELKTIEAESIGDCSNCMLLVREVRRLRGLIKGAEDDGAAESLHSSNCPWCSYAIGDWKRRHAPECPAFTESGDVR